MKDLVAEHEIGFAEGRRKGREAGFIKGFAEGFAKGFVESFAEGELKKTREMAKSLKEQNVAMAIIVKSSGLSEEEIKSL
jgi:flagellar biosynthesis/type III secretory pathway protein FliH